MTGAHPAVFWVAVPVAAWLLVRLPRRLFVEAAEAAPPRRLEWGMTAGLAGLGAVVFQAAGDPSPMTRLTFALSLMILAAAVYSDLTYLLIPDLYSAAVAALALTAPWRLPLVEALLGAALCGGLLAGVALFWRRAIKVEGLGFGDVKLAAAVGGLLGAQHGLLAISISAALAAGLVFAMRLISRSPDAAPLIPYGAALALAAGGFLTVSLL